MISYLKGSVFYVATDYVIVVVNNVGYKVYLNSDLLTSLRQGLEVELYIYQNVKEDALDLYGFSTLQHLDMFEKLVSISGIGPKSALGILAAASLENLEAAIVRGDVSILTKVSGIGKKTAERVVLELKGKLGSVDLTQTSSSTSSDVEVIEALESLGYSADQARQALKEVSVEYQTTDEKLKAALKVLGK